MKAVCKGCLDIMEHRKSKISNKWLCIRCSKPYISEEYTSMFIGEK